MTALDRLRQSEAWNPEFDLPVGTGHNNPWQYLGYARLVLLLSGEDVENYWVLQFYGLCRVSDGLIRRWPDSTIPTSHDEAMGAAATRVVLARAIAGHLRAHGGNYDSHGVPGIPGRWNIYRLPWLRAYLEAREGNVPSPWDQAFWVGRLLLGAITDRNGAKKGPRPRLQNWLMAAEMRRFPACRVAWSVYRWSIERGGCSLANDLRQEPAWPALAALAPDRYLHPGEE